MFKLITRHKITLLLIIVKIYSNIAVDSKQL